MADEPRYWFRAKRWGWGWGLPLTWEGWVVFVGFFVLVIGGSVVLASPRPGWLYYGYVTALCVLLFAICYAKGEPPRRKDRR